MGFNVRPVFVVGKAWPVLPQPDGALQVIIEKETADSTIETFNAQLKERLGSDVTILEPTVLREDADITKLKESAHEVDALLVHVMGLMPLGKLLDLELPLIAFSGKHTPMMGLYAFPIEERESHPNLTYALDFKEINDQIHLLSVAKRLKNTRIALIGGPLSLGGHQQHIPDSEIIKHKLGIDIVPVSGKEFVAEMKGIEESKVATIAQEWIANAQEASEPSTDEIKEVARTYVAIENVLKKIEAQATAIGCLELMYLHGITPHCFALATLRDEGVPASCESDVSALLTMLILGYLSDKPTYMGNIVRADPEKNIVMISHGCTPSKMAGLNQPSHPYKLVHSYSGRFIEGTGLTSFVDLDKGQEVTIARIARNLDRICVTSGEIIDCRDTLCDRTTLDIHVNDARKFFHNAPGNHHVVVYGNYIPELGKLSQLLGMKLIES
ncbi:MAG: hypothetical protein HQ553_08485 [Chloroflexi bacterium]|nr:hypothetical protein [Chloroflexota bacterium]